MATPGPRRTRTRAKLLVAAATVVLGLVLLEVAVRVRQYRRYGTTVTTYYHMEVDPASGLRIPRPSSVVGPIRVNSLGFRGPEIERPKPAGRLRVAFLGGSTTFCAEASSEAATWPELVVAGLRADAPDVEFDCVNGGGAGWSTSESLLNLEHRVKPLEPDVIVVYHGTNDLTQDTRRLAIRQGLYAPGEGDTLAIGEWWLTWFLVEKNLRQLARTRPGAGARLELDSAALSEAFRERLTRLVAEARAVAPVVVLVTFAHEYRREQPPDERRAAAAASLYYMPFLDVDALLALFEDYNRVVREVARASGAVLVEDEFSIPGDDAHFADSVHFRDPGLALQARRVLDALLPAARYRELLETRRRAAAGR